MGVFFSHKFQFFLGLRFRVLEVIFHYCSLLATYFHQAFFRKTLFFLEIFFRKLIIVMVDFQVSFFFFFFPPLRFYISCFIFFIVFVFSIKGDTSLQWSFCHVFIFYFNVVVVLLSFHLHLLQQCVLFIAITKPKPFTITPFLHLLFLLQKCICFCVLVHSGHFANCSG